MSITRKDLESLFLRTAKARLDTTKFDAIIKGKSEIVYHLNQGQKKLFSKARILTATRSVPIVVQQNQYLYTDIVPTLGSGQQAFLIERVDWSDNIRSNRRVDGPFRYEDVAGRYVKYWVGLVPLMFGYRPPAGNAVPQPVFAIWPPPAQISNATLTVEWRLLPQDLLHDYSTPDSALAEQWQELIAFWAVWRAALTIGESEDVADKLIDALAKPEMAEMMAYYNVDNNLPPAMFFDDAYAARYYP